MSEIGVREAIIRAKEYLAEVYADDQFTNLLLEEIDRKDDGNWLITLGFDRYKSPPDSFLNIPDGKRVFKIFEIDLETGDVNSMKIRELCQTY